MEGEQLVEIPVDAVMEPMDLEERRADHQGLVELAQSIAQVGLIHPVVVVREGELFRLVAGRRRFLAHRMLNRQYIRARVVEDDRRLLALAKVAENLQRENLSPVEEAGHVRDLMAFEGLGVGEVARRLGKSESWVRSRVDLLTWPVPFVEAVAAGQLSMAAARELVGIDDESWRAYYFRYAVDQGISAELARAWRREYERQREMARAEGAAPVVPVADQPRFIVTRACLGCEDELPMAALLFEPLCVRCRSALLSARRLVDSGSGGPG